MEEFKRVLNNRQPKLYNMKGYFVSAVLLPVIEVDGSMHVLFEVRSKNLKRQPGEICFPGGMVEDGELDRPEDTAIRETVEELGIAREKIEILGPLDYFISPIGALIYPYLGRIAGDAKIVPSADEVAEVFLVPVSYFLSARPAQSSIDVSTRFAADFPFHKIPTYYKAGWRILGTSPVYFYEYGGKLIWGATAGILYSFIDIYRKNRLT